MAIGRNSIVILGLVAAFILGTLMANPVVEAVGGWKLAFQGLDTRITDLENQQVPESQTYEVSGVGLIPQGETRGEEFQLVCQDGDWMMVQGTPAVDVSPSLAGTVLGVGSVGDLVYASPITQTPPTSVAMGRTIIPAFTGANEAPFEIEATYTILCFSPTS